MRVSLTRMRERKRRQLFIGSFPPLLRSPTRGQGGLAVVGNAHEGGWPADGTTGLGAALVWSTCGGTGTKVARVRVGLACAP
jgi:hypothetical protein